MAQFVITKDCMHYAYMFYFLPRNLNERSQFIDTITAHGVNCVFHYVPLHNYPQDQKVACIHGDLAVTEELVDRLDRLPLWVGLEKYQEEVAHLSFETTKGIAK
jgi:dTDP-4-amino-4,6-dideoxygalactose transaminase